MLAPTAIVQFLLKAVGLRHSCFIFSKFSSSRRYEAEVPEDIEGNFRKAPGCSVGPASYCTDE